MRAIVLLLPLLATVLAQEAPPVRVDLYYETLCPYSIAFVVDQLYPTWTELKTIMEVEMFPFGNANYEADPDGGWTFTCQHGADECRGNMIHACAKDYFNDINIEMEFVYCLLSAEYPPNAGAACAAQVGQPWEPIDSCVSSQQGEELLHDVAVQQEKLDPSLYFVPWILVNDTFSEDQVTACQTDLKQVVCDTYTGPAPAECGTMPRVLPAPISPRHVRSARKLRVTALELPAGPLV